MHFHSLFYLFQTRYGCFLLAKQKIEEHGGGFDQFSRGYDKFGLQIHDDNSITWREWAPGAHSIHLYGEFSKLSI